MKRREEPARPQPTRARGAAPTSAERLQRLLALVPYVVSRKAVGLADTAEAFGLTERELVDDLNLLWCVELRDPDPYCPIDLSYEDGQISLSQAESITEQIQEFSVRLINALIDRPDVRLGHR